MIPLRVEMALRLQQIERCRPVWRLWPEWRRRRAKIPRCPVGGGDMFANFSREYSSFPLKRQYAG